MGREMSTRWLFPSVSAIMDEIATVTPIYGGISYDRLDDGGLAWPCPTANHPGTQFLHPEKFSRGLGHFHAIKAQDPAELPDDEYPLILSTGRVLYHYHTGTMTRRSAPLAWREPNGYIEINPVDAKAAGLQDSGAVIVKSRRGEVYTEAKLTENVPPGTVFLAFHWREAPANMLTQDFKLDPTAKIPEFKVCAVRLEKPGNSRK